MSIWPLAERSKRQETETKKLIGKSHETTPAATSDVSRWPESTRFVLRTLGHTDTHYEIVTSWMNHSAIIFGWSDAVTPSTVVSSAADPSQPPSCVSRAFTFEFQWYISSLPPSFPRQNSTTYKREREREREREWDRERKKQQKTEAIWL